MTTRPKWESRPLGEIFELSSGKSIVPGGSGCYPAYGSNGLIGCSNVAMFPSGVIIGRVGAYCGSIELCTKPFWASDNTIVARPRSAIADLRFSYYMLLNAGLNKYAGGSAQPLMTQSVLKPLIFKLPPLPVQIRIASILGAYDDLIEVNRRRIAVLEEMARRLFDEWFVNFRFPGHEGHEMVKTINGAVPEGWEFRELSAIAELRMGQSPPSETYNETGNGLPFHQGVSDFGLHFPVDRVFTTAVDTDRIGEPGDILFSVRAPVGRINVSLSRIVLGRGVAAVRGKETHSFLLEAIRQRFQETDQMGNGTIFKSVTKRDVATITLIWPPLEFRQRFEGFCAPLWDQIRVLTISSRRLISSRDLLLPRLISGELSLATAERELEDAA